MLVIIVNLGQGLFFFKSVQSLGAGSDDCKVTVLASLKNLQGVEESSVGQFGFLHSLILVLTI